MGTVVDKDHCIHRDHRLSFVFFNIVNDTPAFTCRCFVLSFHFCHHFILQHRRGAVQGVVGARACRRLGMGGLFAVYLGFL